MYNKFFTLALLVAVVSARRNGNRDRDDRMPAKALGAGNGKGSKAHGDPDYLNYQARNNKHYATVEQESQHRELFHLTDDHVRMRNAQADASANPRALRLRHNMMSDMTLEEKMAFMGLDQVKANEGALDVGLPRRRNRDGNGRDRDGNGRDRDENGRDRDGNGRNRDGNGRRGRGLEETATNVDHNLLGHMFPVKDQGSCGSCWAFTSNSTLEGTIAAKTGKSPVRISEQHLVDCSGATGNGGCNGGWMSSAWRYQ